MIAISIPISIPRQAMLALDSTKWTELEHAYRDASDTPDLIRAIASEQPPNYDKGGAWNDVYSSLFHLRRIYSATYAAFPHIVSVTMNGTLQQQIATLIFAGQIRVFGNSESPIPEELVPEFESAIESVESSSIDIVRDAWHDADTCTRGELLQAFGGLRFPKNGCVVQLDYLTQTEWMVEATCPTCNRAMVCQLEDDWVSTAQIGHGGQPIAESAKRCPVNREDYMKAIHAGRDVLSYLSNWNEDSTPFVLAALAAELRDGELTQKILDLGTTIWCAHCAASFVMSEALAPL